MDSLRRISGSLINIFSSNLLDWHIQLEDADGFKLNHVNSGVPRGFIRGPTLWNILNDEMLSGVALVGVVDDIALANERLKNSS